jgi:hypothetical protein
MSDNLFLTTFVGGGVILDVIDGVGVCELVTVILGVMVGVIDGVGVLLEVTDGVGEFTGGNTPSSTTDNTEVKGAV